MSKAVICVGLPASGKSTWAKAYCINNDKWHRVNRDDLRNMLGKYMNQKREDLVTDIEVATVESILNKEENVIIDNTNLNPKVLEFWQNFFYENKVQFQIKDFTDISVEECIKRDSLRLDKVGERVIRDMHRKYLKLKEDHSHEIKQDVTLPHAIICDLDGTLALFGNKNPYERDFINDELNKAVNTCIKLYVASGRQLILFSGRSSKYLQETQLWLHNNGVEYHTLKMREEGDNRKDSIVKKEMFDNIVKDKYYIDFVLDDRLQVCRLWYSLGLPIFRVGDPDADF